MVKFIKNKIMAFKDIFKDDNVINEKNVVGFASFAVMGIFATADIVTGFFGKDLVIQEFEPTTWYRITYFKTLHVEEFILSQFIVALVSTTSLVNKLVGAGSKHP